jgi:transcriptional regulator NrdR family protein
MGVLKKSGFIERFGKDKIFPNIDKALARALKISAQQKNRIINVYKHNN